MLTFEEIKNPGRNGDIGWKIIDNRQSVGKIYGKPVMHGKQKCFGITWLTISKHQRGKGYGRATIELLEKILKKKYNCFLAVSVGGPNKKVAKKFWESQGFDRIGSTSNYLKYL